MRRSAAGRGFTDWSPLNHAPEVPDSPDGLHLRDLVHARVTGSRNGHPEPVPYRWRPGDAEREQEIQARLAAIRTRLQQRSA